MTLKQLLAIAAATVALAGCSGTNNLDGISASQSQIDELTNKIGDRVYFELDSSGLSSDAKHTLEKQSAFMADNPELMFNIEGHCDERGTREYNLALGERRATQAAQYLISSGVNASRLSTVSYGKERPEALGHDEGSYAQNRRAVTAIK